MKARDFLNAFDIRVLAVIYNQVQQGEGLVQSDLVSGGFASDTVYDVTLESKLLRKDSRNDGRLPVFGEPEDNAAGFLDHVT